MKVNAWLVHLRPDSAGIAPDLFSLWFEDCARRNCILSRGDRLWWGTTESRVRSAAARIPELCISDKSADLIDVFQVARDLFAPTDGAEARVLTCLSFLDDLCVQLDVVPPATCVQVIDEAVDRLTFGGNLDSLFDAVGGADTVADSLGWLLDCVLTHSSFDLDEVSRPKIEALEVVEDRDCPESC